MTNVELRDFLDFRFLSSLSLSPAGTNACFIVSTCDEKNNTYIKNIWHIDPETGTTRPLTASGDIRSFIWLDEATILFCCSKSGRYSDPSTEYFRLDVNCGEEQPAFTIPLLTESIVKLDETRFVVQAKTNLNAPEDLPENGASWTIMDELPFAENGVGYVSGIRHRLFIYDTTDGSILPLMNERFQVRNGYAVHPEGKWIAYCGMEIDYMEVQKLGIFVYDVATKETKQILPMGRYKLRHIDFMGDKVLFTGADGSRYVWSQNAWFYTLDPVTAEEKVFYESYQMPINNSVGSDCHLGASRQHKVVGESVYHVITENGSAQMVCVTKDGQRYVTHTEGSVDGFDICNDHALMIAGRKQNLQEIFSVDLKTGEEKQLTRLNADYTESHTLSVPVSCDFVNDNGDNVQGWVIPPVGYETGKKYPAILDIHGGPKTAYGSTYFHEMQYWANHGYFVFFCNPRGSDGRGDEFGFLMTRYGTVDYDDIMAFTDIVLERYPDIDTARIGVTGGSYGGYMTNWIIGHTDRFAAAASQRSISNWITDEGASDWSYMYSPCRFGGISARIKFDEGWASSPLKFAGNAVTPTLFIHSEEDFRCPLGEALQMYTAILHKGVESRICLFKGENHELSRSGGPKNRVKRLEEITAWMDSHLKA